MNRLKHDHARKEALLRQAKHAAEPLERQHDQDIDAALEALFEHPDGSAILAAIADGKQLPGAWLSAVTGQDATALLAFLESALSALPARERAQQAAVLLDTLASSLGLGPVMAPMAQGQSVATDTHLDRLFEQHTAWKSDQDRKTALAGVVGDQPETVAKAARLRSELLAELGISDRNEAATQVAIVDDLGPNAGLSTPDGILLDARHFRPERPEGRGLLAHELAHVAQRQVVGQAHTAFAEAEAGAVMARAARGDTLPVPNVPLAPSAEAACGVREMNARKREPIPITGPDPDKITPITPITPPQPTPTPDRENAEGEGDCEDCPDPAPESQIDAPVKPPPATPPSGDGAARELKFAGHTIHIRLPPTAKQGTVRINFRQEDSPFAGLRLKSAVLTLDESLTIIKGEIDAALNIGKFVKIPKVTLSISRNGFVSASIENALIQLGATTRARVSLYFTPKGMHGSGRIEWKDIKLVSDLVTTGGFLDVKVTEKGAVTAHGKLAVDIKGIGKAELEACYVDEELRGSLTVEFTKEFPIIPGLLRVTRIKARGCLKKNGWRLTASIAMAMRDWLEGEVEATVHPDGKGGLSWEVKGHVQMAKARQIGALTINGAKLAVAWKDGKWKPLTGHLDFELTLPTAHAPVIGRLEGSYDFETEKVNGRGDMRVDGGIDLAAVGATGLRLESAHVTGHIKDSELTHIEGAADFQFIHEGLPTFSVNCQRALYDIKKNELHADGEMEVLRNVTIGDPGGLHGFIARGPAGFFAVRDGTLLASDFSVPFELRHAEKPVGLGGIKFSYHDKTGLDGEIRFGLIDRLGLPDMAAGPVFLEPGGEAKVVVQKSALSEARLEGLQFSVKQADGGGMILGTAAGFYNFGNGEAALDGQAWVESPWTVSLGAFGQARIEKGGEAVVGLTHAGLNRLDGTLPFHADLTPPIMPPFSIAGNVSAAWNAEKGTFTGDFDTHLVEGSNLEIAAGDATRITVHQGAAIKGSYDGTSLAGPLSLDCKVDVAHNEEPLFTGDIANGIFNPENGEIGFDATLQLLAEPMIALAGGRTLAVDGSQSEIVVKVAKSALQSAVGSVGIRIDDAVGPLFAGRIENASIGFAETLVFTGGIGLTLARDLDFGDLQIPLPAGVHATLIPGGTLAGQIVENELTSLELQLPATLGWGGIDYVEANLGGTWDLEKGKLAGAFDAKLIQAIDFGAGAEDASDMSSWALRVETGSSFSAALSDKGLEELAIAFDMRIVRSGEAVAEGLLAGTWTPGDDKSLTGQFDFRMLQDVDLAIAAGRFGVWLGAETAGQIQVADGGIASAGGLVVLSLVEGGFEKAKMALSANFGAGAISGEADLQVVDPIVLSETVVGDHVYRVDLSTRTAGRIGVEKSRPTVASGTFGVDIAQNNQVFGEMDASLDIDFQAHQSPVNAFGNLRVIAGVDLGTNGDFLFSLEPGTAAQASLTNGGLDFLEGVLCLGMKRDGVKVALVEIGGRYEGGKSPNVSGQASIDILTSFALFDDGVYSFGLAPSKLSAQMANGSIVAASGRIELYAEARGGEEDAPLGSVVMSLEGSYVAPAGKSGTFDGKGRIVVDGSFPVAEAGNWSIVLEAGSSVMATVAANKFTEIDGELHGRVDQVQPGAGETKEFLALSGTVKYRPEKGGIVDAHGSCQLIGTKKVFDNGTQSFWLTSDGAGTGAQVEIVKNKLHHVTGSLSGAVHHHGKPLFSASVEGHYDGESGNLSGSGELELLSNLTVPEGATSGFRLELQAGTKGRATVAKSSIERLSGSVHIKALDDDGPLFSIKGSGEFDATKGRIIEATGSATLLRPFDVGGEGDNAMLRVMSASGSGHIVNDELQAIQGRIDFQLPKLLGMKGFIEGGWKRGKEGGKDEYWGAGQISFELPDKDGKGRNLGATIGLEISKGGAWRAKGRADFELLPGMKVGVEVDVDEKLDPVIGADFTLPPTQVIPGMTLFEAAMRMGIDVPGPIVGVGFGIGIGIGAKMRPMMFDARVGFSDWRPLSQKQSVPTFEADLGINWGFDFTLDLSAYLQLSLGLGSILSFNAGAEAGIEMRLPLEIAPRGKLFGGPDGLGGELDLNVSVKPTAALVIKPYVGGSVLGSTVGPFYLTELRNELGTLFEWTWAKRYAFGDKPKAPEAIAPSGAVTRGAQTEKAEKHTKPKPLPESAPKTPKGKEGMPDFADMPGKPKADGKKPEGEKDKLGLIMEALDALKELIGEVEPYLKMIEEDGIRGAIKAISKATGKSAWERICKKARVLYRAMDAAFPDMQLAYSLPMWLVDIMESPEGQSLSLWDAYMEEDDRVRDKVKEGKHKTLPTNGRVQYMKALLDGHCGYDDEVAVLEILRHSASVGDLYDVVNASGGYERLDDKVNGRENDRLHEILEKGGYFKRSSAEAQAFLKRLRGEK